MLLGDATQRVAFLLWVLKFAFINVHLRLNLSFFKLKPRRQYVDGNHNPATGSPPITRLGDRSVVACTDGFCCQPADGNLPANVGLFSYDGDGSAVSGSADDFESVFRSNHRTEFQ